MFTYKKGKTTNCMAYELEVKQSTIIWLVLKKNDNGEIHIKAAE